MTEEMSIRLPYQRVLYVEREPELAKTKEWLNGNKRLLTITANPATGKTWFLWRMQEEFAQEGVINFRIDTKALLPERDAAQPPHILPQRLGEWLIEFIQALQQVCSEINIDLTAAQDLLLDKVAEAIVEQCWPDQEVYLFVDGGDELSEGGWREFEQQILEPLAARQRIRFVIALRSKQRVQLVPLRYSEQRINLEVWPDGYHDGNFQGDIQLNLLLAHNAPNAAAAAALQELLETFPDYDKTHPGLNTLFYQLAQADTMSDIDGLAFLKVALQAVITGLEENELDNVVNLLLGIADFEDTWAVADIQQWLGISNSRAWEYVQTLKRLFLVADVVPGQQKIQDGMRSFVRSVLNVVSPVALQMDGDRVLNVQERQQFIQELARSLQEDPAEIHDLGTSRLVLDLPAESANKLKTMVERGDLGDLNITAVTFIANRSRLATLIKDSFNRTELEDVCFHLDIPYDEWEGRDFTPFVREVITFCERHGRLGDLVRACARLRPHMPWPTDLL